MPQEQITDERPATESQTPTISDDDLLREQAVKQVERVRSFKLATVASFIGMLLLTCIWAFTEYHNSGGWPHHFSESSGTPGTWNDWIIWPWIAWVFFTCIRAYAVYVRRPPSEADIEREMDRIRGGR